MRQERNPLMIRNRERADLPGWSQYNATSPEMREMLGLAPNAKLPVEGMPPRNIQGWTVYVRPLPPRGDSRRRRCAHRVRAICPKCRKDISAGRTHQHKCKTEPNANV